ncbi:MAG: hypothetical protein ACRC2T_14425, partial [Thermoguttaceae bacterium]
MKTRRRIITTFSVLILLGIFTTAFAQFRPFAKPTAQKPQPEPTKVQDIDMKDPLPGCRNLTQNGLWLDAL